MQSAHELRENDRRLAALRNGLHSQRSDTRLAALATEPAGYLYYRMIWAETRLRISQLIPTTSLRSSGKLMMKGGVVSWIEDESSAEEKPGPNKRDSHQIWQE